MFHFSIFQHWVLWLLVVRLELEDGRREAGGRRKEAGGRRKEAGGRRKEAGVKFGHTHQYWHCWQHLLHPCSTHCTTANHPFLPYFSWGRQARSHGSRPLHSGIKYIPPLVTAYKQVELFAFGEYFLRLYLVWRKKKNIILDPLFEHGWCNSKVAFDFS